MREDGGIDVINEAIQKLSKTHAEHISQYGLGNEARLTGAHEVIPDPFFLHILITNVSETCPVKKFSGRKDPHS